MLQTDDINIRKHDIQSLNNRDAIYAFLTHLGYDTNNPQKFPDPRSLGITTDSLVREIKSIEQLANNDGLLYVYFVCTDFGYGSTHQYPCSGIQK
jgi:hypothetical protein